MTTQTATKHSPGPWTILRSNVTGWRLVMPPDGTLCVASVNDYGGVPAEANARLIAAATELLDVLQQMMEFWDNGSPVHAGAEIVSEARAAIRKATGE